MDIKRHYNQGERGRGREEKGGEGRGKEEKEGKGGYRIILTRRRVAYTSYVSLSFYFYTYVNTTQFITITKHPSAPLSSSLLFFFLYISCKSKLFIQSASSLPSSRSFAPSLESPPTILRTDSVDRLQDPSQPDAPITLTPPDSIGRGLEGKAG